MSRLLSHRVSLPELMDQPGLPAAEHEQALAGLARLNWFSASSRILWPPLRRLAHSQPGRTIRVLDLACGGGDVTLALAERAWREGRSIKLAGCDSSSTALSVARANARKAGQEIDFFESNVLNGELPADYDAIVCSLFLHHLSDEEAEMILRRMAQAARQLVLVNDLVRSAVGYCLALLASRLLTFSPIVRVDAPLSVRRAFTPAEALRLARQAGLEQAAVSRRWPARFLLQWSKA